MHWNFSSSKSESLSLTRCLQLRHELVPQNNQRIVWWFFHVKDSSKKQLKTIHVVLWLYLVGLWCCYVYKPMCKRMLMCISCHSMCLHDQLLLWWCIKIHNACRKVKRISSMQKPLMIQKGLVIRQNDKSTTLFTLSNKVSLAVCTTDEPRLL